MVVPLQARSYVSISPDSPQELNWFTEQIWRFCYLLTLLTDEVVSPTGVQVFCVDDDYPRWHLYKSRKEQKAEESVTPVFLFHLGHLLGQFDSILKRWFLVDETMLDAIHLTMDGQRNPEHSTGGCFLLLAHAVDRIETFAAARSISHRPLETMIPIIETERFSDDTIGSSTEGRTEVL